MDIKVETTTDFHELAKLNETVQTWHHDSFPDEFKPFDIRAMEKAFEKMLQGDNVFAFIARYQNKPIGYLFGYVKTRPDSAFQYEKTVLHIDQVVVSEEYQKSGVGQLLMDEAHKLSKTKQIKEVQLDFWTGNQQAESFFLKNGFDFMIHEMKK
ncbi:GNAT family N-acetyltransferase [Salibacteraceae bacterium]|jgi:diamine N-acetyltransferase|nr:GNAT family N-acetyltransferase [Salibacteraceae bacterium]